MYRLILTLALIMAFMPVKPLQAQNRDLGAHRFWLDDNEGHRLLLQFLGPTAGVVTFPSGASTTIAIGGGPDQTLRWNGSAWVADSTLLNNGTIITLQGQLVSLVPNGTSPIILTSQTVIPNLNADMIDGMHSEDFVADSLSITTVAPLTGGGPLSGDLLLGLDYDASLKLTEGGLGINLANSNTWTAAQLLPASATQGDNLIGAINSATATINTGRLAPSVITESDIGTGMSITSGVLSNGGVLTVTGTTGEIEATPASGNVVLSLPETINANISGNAATATTALTANYADSARAAGRLANTPESGNSVIIAINSADSTIYPSALDPMVLLQTEVVGTANEITVSEAGGTLTLSLPETINANISGNAATATTALTVHYADTAGVANTLANTFAAGASAIAALSTNGDTLTNSTLGTANNVTGIVAVSNGGTGTSTYAKGDMLYADTISSFAKLPIGTENQVLYVTGGKPTWGSVPAAGAAPYAVYSGVLDVTSDPFLVPDSVVNGSTVVFITESISGDPVLTLSDGNTPGQLLILVNHDDLSHIHLHDEGNINIQNPDFHFHQHGDNITLLWCGSIWVEVSRTNQD